MAKRRKKKKSFLFLAPVLIILGAVVFFVTLRKLAPPIASEYSDLTGKFKEEEKMAVFEGEEILTPALSTTPEEKPILGLAYPSERWVEIDLSEQKLRAWNGSSLYLETPISTGLPWWPTPTGEFRIWIKLRYTKMEGGSGRYYYYLPNVPYVMYFQNGKVPSWRGYGLHGTYWHNDFGTQRSHGCVNLPTPIAGKLFYWTTPDLGDKKWATWATENNPGTRIVIHQ